MRTRADPGDDVDGTAVVLHRLAVLLDAGVPPPSAWQHAAGPQPPKWLPGVVLAAGRDPTTISQAIAAAARSSETRHRSKAADPERASPIAVVAAIWEVASVAGAPLAGALRAAAIALRDVAELQRRTRVALAGPRATMRLVVAMPIVAVAFGVLLGYDTLGVLFGTPVGWGCLCVGTGLTLAGRTWSRRLVVRASRMEPMPGLVFDLLAVAMASGASIDRARSIVEAAAESVGLGTSTADADGVVAMAESAGAPLAELLRAEAEQSRRTAAADASSRAAALETTLMIPLGVCVLPAFVVLGVVPLLIAVLSSTLSIV